MFKPRFTDAGMRGSKYYYSDNPFHNAYPESSPEYLGLPNCTCYAWGRSYEITGKRPTLPLGNAEEWWNTVNKDDYKIGQTPKLGAVICFADGPYSGYGHVAVVEEIKTDGTVIFSNSGYGAGYFYLKEGKKENNYGYESGYIFQGFIYNKVDEDIPIPTKFYPTTLTAGIKDEKKMQNNALIIWDYFTKKGWTLNAIAGVLGNMEVESFIGPDQGEIGGGGGYGLTQWTPPTAMINWCNKNGYSGSDGFGQIAYINEEMIGNEPQYYPTDSYPLSSTEFIKSTESPEYLASAFLYNYERAGVTAETDRRKYARKWYDYLSDLQPVPPEETKSFKFIYYMRPIRLRS